MKILLYDTGDVRGELNEPVGIELLAANVLNELKGQVTVDIRWYNFDEYSFDPLQYDIIGVSIHINGLNVFENIYKYCRKRSFKGLLIAGNSIATFAYIQLLEKYPDIICSIGEGEYTFTKIVQGYLRGGLDLTSIPNLAYVNQGRLNTTKRVFCDMEKYLPPLRIYNEQLKKYRGITRIEASRGCSWNKCNFCGTAHKYNNAGWRPINVDIVLNQLVELSNNGLTNIYFCDEDFIGNDRKRFAYLVKQIQEKKDNGEISKNMKFFISIKPTDLIHQTNMEILKIFISYGLNDLFIGLESGCESQLKRYNKCTNIEINTFAITRIKELKEYGLTIDIGYIFFDYNMTAADIEENIKFIENNKLYMLASSLIKPLRIQPFTKMFIDTPEIHMNDLSIDDLMYNYHFVDNIVEQIYSTYSNLNLESIAHKLQSEYRREMASAFERKLVSRNLLKLRFLQFSAIKTISIFYIHNEINELQLKYKLDKILLNAASLLETYNNV